MEEWGVGPLSDNDPEFSDLLSEPWDGRVRIHNLKYTFERLLDTVPSDPEQMGGMITFMTLEFGPIAPKPFGDEPPLHAEISQIIRFKVFDSVDLRATQKGSRRRLPSRETLSARNIDMMHTWIGDCESNHDTCRLPSPTDRWLPTRLLDIGPSGTSHAPRVIETKETPVNNQPYAALSHMWGDVETAPPLQAMQFNYSSLQEGITFPRLPPSFADAVETCHRLGFQYIWIDSLCIIQDSKEDWEREAATMHEVYRNAKVTLVSTSSTSSQQAFLVRDLPYVPAVKAIIDDDRFFIITPIDDRQSGVRHGDIEGSRWNTRGWTMQERALSTRSIHFGRNKIYFECRGCLRSEENDPGQARDSDQFQLFLRSTGLDPSVWYDHWMRIVVGYSRRRLTVPSDKLKAIQSIANDMGNHLIDEYIPAAAMWKGNLLNELLWYVQGGIPRRVPGRAPSWSWASLDANISFLKGGRHGEPPIDAAKIWDGGVLLGTPDPHDIEIRGNVNIPGEFLSPGLDCYLFLLSSLCPVDDDKWERTSFPFDVMMHIGTSSEAVVFGHGMLDLDNRDNVLAARYQNLYYLHISNGQRPSGLLVHSRRVVGAGYPVSSPEGRGIVYCSRVGVATVFEVSGKTINPDAFREAIKTEYAVLY